MSFTLLFRQKATEPDQKMIEAADAFRSECGQALEDIFIERLHSVTPEYMATHGRIYRVDARTADMADAEQAKRRDECLLLLLMAIGLERGFVPMNEDGEAIYDPAMLGLDAAALAAAPENPDDLPEILSFESGAGGEIVLVAAGSHASGSDRAGQAHAAYLRLLRRAAAAGLAAGPGDSLA